MIQYPQVENLYVPFLDFFDNYSKTDSVYNFGSNSRNAALKYVKSFDHVIDVGAHVGISTIHWAKSFKNITAFEPMIDHFNCLKENTKSLSGVVCINSAISDEPGELYGSYRTIKNSGSFQLLDKSFVQSPNKATKKLYTIQVNTLDSYDFERLDLLKVDVEGWEFEVLKGAQETIKKHKPVLLIEFTGGNSRKSLHTYDVEEYRKLIDSLDYVAVENIESDTIYVSR